MFRSFPFGSLAFALLIATISMHFARDAHRLLGGLDQGQNRLSAALSRERGLDLNTSGPFIDFAGTPLHGPGGEAPLRPRNMRLYPSMLRVEINASQQPYSEGATHVRWILADIALTARFEPPPDWADLDWNDARLRLPFPYGNSLVGAMQMTVDGRTETVVAQRLQSRGKVSAARRISGLPQDDVVIRYRQSMAGPMLSLWPVGIRTEALLTTDFTLDRFSGPLPDGYGIGPGRKSVSWTIDRSGQFDGVWDRVEDPAPKTGKGFLGISMHEPDETGPMTLNVHTRGTDFAGIGRATGYAPLAFAAAALMAALLGLHGLLRQVGLFLAGLVGLAATLWLSPRIMEILAWAPGPFWHLLHVPQAIAWAAGGAVAAFGALATWSDRGTRPALAVALVYGGSWIALWSVPLGHPGYPLPWVTAALYFAHPGLGLAMLVMAVAALVQGAVLWRDRRRPA